MTVPETGRDHQAPAIENRGILRNLNRCAWPDRRDTPIVYKDGTALNRLSRRGWINLRIHQGQVLRAAEFARKQRTNQKERGSKENAQTALRSHTPLYAHALLIVSRFGASDLDAK